MIALGGALGGVTRYLCAVGVSRYVGESFPWGTLFVNGLGTFLLGALMGAGVVQAEQESFYGQLYGFAAVGFCGGLTTFSTFSLQTLSLTSKGQTARAALNILGSVGLCLLCGVAGFALMKGWGA